MSASASRGPSAKLGWYLRRLQVMSPAEVAWRATDQVRKYAWEPYQVRPGAPSDLPATEKAVHRTPQLVDEPRFAPVLPLGALGEVPVEAREATMAAAERLMEGHWEILGVERSDMVDPDWFFDPITGKRAPRERYCFKVDHRRQEVTGNVKQIWELSRHHHLTVLAAAYAFSGQERFAERAAAHLRSWWEENPFLSGVNWTSGIEAGIRLISWVWVRRLLDGWTGAAGLFEENPRATEQIWWHQRYLAAFRSRGSSANNHVIAEAAGQLVAALAFDWFRESQKWADQAADLLQAELAHNTFPSGVNREMAFEYHGLVAELGLLAAAEADRAGRPLDDSTWALLSRMTDVVAAAVDERLGAPRFGDGDDGKALVLDPGANRWESLLSTGRALFGAAEWWPASRPDAWSTLVAALASKHAGYERPAHRPDQWDDAGLTILRTAPGEHPEIWCRCDAGPHGFMAIAAHGHADALSVEVRHGGVEVLADPGTYCYHGEARWRSYFRSTLGHNTLEVGGRDQSVPGGPFLWLQHARSRRTSPGLVSPDGAATDVLTWSAEHDGYRSLKPPATHRRTVRLWPAARRLEMTDEVDCGDAVSGGEPPFRLAFHFGPGVSAVLDGESLQLAWETPEGAAHSAVMELAPTVTWRLARGEDNPVLGWYSPRFGVKEPAFSVVGQGFGNGAKLVTVLHFGPGIDPRDRN